MLFRSICDDRQINHNAIGVVFELKIKKSFINIISITELSQMAATYPCMYRTHLPAKEDLVIAKVIAVDESSSEL